MSSKAVPRCATPHSRTLARSRLPAGGLGRWDLGDPNPPPSLPTINQVRGCGATPACAPGTSDHDRAFPRAPSPPFRMGERAGERWQPWLVMMHRKQTILRVAFSECARRGIGVSREAAKARRGAKGTGAVIRPGVFLVVDDGWSDRAELHSALHNAGAWADDREPIGRWVGCGFGRFRFWGGSPWGPSVGA